jgi:hypothetical protein
MPELKETDYFLSEGNWSRGIDWYRDLFSDATPGQIVGEASPGYTMFPTFAGAAERMAGMLPNVLLIYLVREPISRMVSAWLHSRADLMEARPLAKALLSDLRYVSLSQYATQLEQYLEHFDRSAVLVLRTEDLAARPEQTMTQVCDFLGIDASLLRDVHETYNRSAAKSMPRVVPSLLGEAMAVRDRWPLHNAVARGMSRLPGILTTRPVYPEDIELPKDVRDRLHRYLEPDMRRLREFVGPDMDLWGYA